ncbi:MAG: toxic anion resistance protein [Angelakisella sp.]|nr:toxic anion resistance protein [Angelakisella sp.]
MEEKFDQVPVPSLTLEGVDALVVEATAPADTELTAADAPTGQEAIQEVILSPEEEAMVAEFIPKIQLDNSTMVLQYGAAAQKKIANFSENILDSVKTKDLGEVGEMLTGVVTELKGFDAEEEKGLFGFFKKSGTKITALKARYDKAEGNIAKICQALETHQVQLLKDTSMLDKMYDLNTAYFKELSLYLVAGKRKLEQVRREELAALNQKASQSNLPEDAQAANDLATLCNRFEKKLHDLELTRMISLQMAPQIRLVQNNNTLMVDKIQSTLVNTIPLWKSQMVLALGMAHSQQAASAQRQVTDMTNQMLRKNAEALKMATIETAKESERGIVDMETLRLTNQNLISTLDEVMRIQSEGRQKRRDAEVELGRLEQELKHKLIAG